MKVERLYASEGRRLVADAKWNPLFPEGEWVHHTGGRQAYTPELVAEFIANWEAAGRPALPVTLGHVPDDLPFADREEAAKAKGWIEDLRASDGGGLAIEAAIKWNDAGKALIDADEVRYISPEWSMKHIDRRSGKVGGAWIYGAALTNNPFFNSMPRVAASDAPIPTHQPNPTASPAKEQHVNISPLMRARLGLAEGATAEDVSAAFEKFIASQESEKLTAAAQSTKLTALAATVDALKASNEALVKQLDTEKATREATELKAVLDAAQREGKAMPDTLRASMADYAKAAGIEGVKTLVASLPVAAKSIGKEIGIAGDESANHSKLWAAAKADLVKSGMKGSEAHMQLIRTNPDLARKAGVLTNTTKEG